MIYLDNAATTKINEKALETLEKYSSECFFNPSASYRLGIENNQAILSAKNSIKSIIGADEKDGIVFCSGATEANNTAIQSFANKRSKQLLFSSGEHPSVYQFAKKLFEQGYDVKFINLQQNGEVDYKQLEELLQKETSFISCMLVSNETGAINDIRRIVELKDQYQPNAIVHSDMVQGFGKIQIDVSELGVDLATISAHKIHGPKGIGALYVKNGIKIKPLLLGGEQETGLRAGTENLPAIMAFKTVCENLNIEQNLLKAKKLRNEFLNGLDGLKYSINGNGSPYVLSLSIDGLRGETLMNMCQEKGVIFGLGSACSSKKVGNRVLEQMKRKNIIGSIRVSFNAYQTVDEIKTASSIIKDQAMCLLEKLK